MPGLASPDIKIAPTQEMPTPQKVESKPIGQRVKDLLQKVREKTHREQPNPDPDGGLTEISSFPNTEPVDTTQPAHNSPPSSLPEPIQTQVRGLSPDVDSQRKQEINKHTKSTEEGRGTRKETAAEAMKQRRAEREMAAKQDELSKRVEEINQKIEQRSQQADQLKVEIDQIQVELDKRASSFVFRVMDKFLPIRERISDRRQNIEEKIQGIDQVRGEEEYSMASLQVELYKLEYQRRGLRKAKDVISQFYEGQGKQMDETAKKLRGEEDRRGAELAQEQRKQEDLNDPRNKVESVMEANNTFLIHSIRPDIIGGQFNFNVDRAAGWQDKLAYVLENKPHLAASSIRSGDTSRNMWGSMGIVLSGGVVSDAQARDTASRVDFSTGERVSGNRFTSVAEQVQSAIASRDPDRYNEIAIRDPEIAGFFITRDSQVAGRHATVPDQQIVEVVTKLNMPLYLMIEGRAYEALYDPATGSLNRGREVVPKEMTQRKYHPPDSMEPDLQTQAEQAVYPESLV